MIIKTKAFEYSCDTAEQMGDEVSLFVGGAHYLTVRLENIQSVTGGDITVVMDAEPTRLDALESKVAYIGMMTGTLTEGML